jgi:hypothetical protein
VFSSIRSLNQLTKECISKIYSDIKFESLHFSSETGTGIFRNKWYCYYCLPVRQAVTAATAYVSLVRQQPIMFCSDYRDRSPPGNDISVTVYIPQPVRSSAIGITTPHGSLIDNKYEGRSFSLPFTCLTNFSFTYIIWNFREYWSRYCVCSVGLLNFTLSASYEHYSIFPYILLSHFLTSVALFKKM